MSSLTTNEAAAPSFIPEELPAVTDPFALNAGLSVASFSTEVKRGCSSFSKRWSRLLLPEQER
jgi:hypothetical protein